MPRQRGRDVETGAGIHHGFEVGVAEHVRSYAKARGLPYRADAPQEP